jgi:hypothetical protein
MFDNWLKSFEEMFTYSNFKKEVIKFNKRVNKFWEDAFNDMFTTNKKK